MVTSLKQSISAFTKTIKMSSVKQIILQRLELLDCLRARNCEISNSSESRTMLFDFITLRHNLGSPSKTLTEHIHRALDTFLKVLKRNWVQCNRTYSALLSRHKNWLHDSIVIENEDLCELPVPSFGTSSKETPRLGRPPKDFSSCGPKTKLRKIQSLIENKSADELSFAAETKFKKTGKLNAAFLLKEISSSPTRANIIKETYIQTETNKSTSLYSPEEALALLVSSKLTKNQYNLLRKGALEKGVNLYPSYYKVQQAKQNCYPSPRDIEVTENKAETKLQAIVDLTVRRFFMAQSVSLEDTLNRNDDSSCKFIFKWGCDGCGSLTRYKQQSLDMNLSDSSVLVTSFVPLRLVSTGEGGQETVLWQNPRTSSTRFCRPIRFRFIKETEQELVNEMSYIKNQIDTLKDTEIQLRNKSTVLVKAEFIQTMVDGKVCNALASNRATQKCYICGSSSKEMNDIPNILNKTCNEHTFSWGLSTLHAYIRFMECILHISYKLHIKKYQVRNEPDKIAVVERKKQIIDSFRSETGLLLDTPKQGGGNTNDGNSARRFFKNASISSRLTGVDKELIERFSVILETLASGCEINHIAFEEYSLKTAKYYVQLYPWYPMPVTVHKILLHAPAIIKRFLLPIGQLSEDVQESRHKEFKTFREHYSRKCSRVDTNADIFHNLLVSSDPIVSLIRPLHTNVQKHRNSVLKLLIQTEKNDSESDRDSLSD